MTTFINNGYLPQFQSPHTLNKDGSVSWEHDLKSKSKKGFFKKLKIDLNLK